MEVIILPKNEPPKRLKTKPTIKIISDVAAFLYSCPPTTTTISFARQIEPTAHGNPKEINP